MSKLFEHIDGNEFKLSEGTGRYDQVLYAMLDDFSKRLIHRLAQYKLLNGQKAQYQRATEVGEAAAKEFIDNTVMEYLGVHLK